METASWVFGGLLVVFIMAVVAHRLIGDSTKSIDPTTHTLLGFLSAILAGLFAFFFTGSVAANVTPTAGRFGSLGIQATGGAALFVIVLWWWRSDKSPISAEDRKTLRALATVFQNIDKLYPGLRSIVRPDETVSDDYRVTSSEEQNAIVFRSRNDPKPRLRITSSDLNKLPLDDRRFIGAKEKSMSKLLDQWSKDYPKRLSGPLEAQEATKKHLQELATEMCKELSGILDHLGSIGMELEDHYGATRSICRELGSQREPLH